MCHCACNKTAVKNESLIWREDFQSFILEKHLTALEKLRHAHTISLFFNEASHGLRIRLNSTKNW